ncbi:MAG: hypothetical protein SNG35_00410 [Rikenellaceae bacterium]
MKQIKYIVYLVVIGVLLSCRQSGQHLFSSEQGRVLAVVGEKRLYSGDIEAAIPSHVEGGDSVDFVKLYIDRWVKHQIKVYEAERIFSSSSSEIERMVESYRSSLLSQKLNQYYLGTTSSTPFSNEDVKRYYEENKSHFKLSKPIIKGIIMRIPVTHDSRTAITTMMRSKSADTRTNLISMCDKSPELLFEEYTSNWIDYSEFIAMLPVARDDQNLYMSRKGVQSLKDDEHIYLFEIVELRKVGEIKPLERVEDQIRMLLTKQFHNEIIRSREEALYQSAMDSEYVKVY